MPALADLLPSARSNTSNASSDAMLTYFLSSLDVRLREVSKPESTSIRADILAEIEKSIRDLRAPTSSLSQEDAWTEAYRIERLFAFVEPPETLATELKRRVAEAADEKVGAYQRLAATADAAISVYSDPKTPGALLPNGEAVLRAILIDTLEEIHWTIQRKFYSRPIRKNATTRIVCFGMAAFALFLWPYLKLYFDVWYGGSNHIENWSWLPIYTAATAGLFGALFSRLLYLQSNWESLTIGGLKDAREFSSIILRACVGIIGAVIIFFFLRSGVIAGSLFPDFKSVGLDEFSFPMSSDGKTPVTGALHLYYPSSHLALLVVWGFLAGFSERLVPTILQDTETSLGKTQK